MNKVIIPLVLIVIAAVLSLSCNSEKKEALDEIKSYKPIDIALQNKIEELDSLFFTAYNTCDLDQQSELISEDIEFFHDKGGLSTSKSDIMEAMKNNICGKVTRELIKGSIEVYPIHNYGAVQIGYHKFFNNQEPDAISNPSKFITIWKNENNTWQMSRIVSLH
ncbi:MAG: nuclear transport factor 2 family protein [Flavobacteriaceae bacterium]|nr:nuclear transport factor 2 family protein [Flavobacteriaceae bacterium]